MWVQLRAYKQRAVIMIKKLGLDVARDLSRMKARNRDPHRKSLDPPPSRLVEERIDRSACAKYVVCCCGSGKSQYRTCIVRVFSVICMRVPHWYEGAVTIDVEVVTHRAFLIMPHLSFKQFGERLHPLW